MKRDVALALAAVLVAFVLLVPTVELLAEGVTGLSLDLAQGSFRPFAQPLRRGGLGGAGGTAFGGFSGASTGNYLPGAAPVPDTWTLDRNGEGGEVTIDYVFDPSLGAMQRLKAYDAVAPDESLAVANPLPTRPVAPRVGDVDDRLFHGSFDVVLHRDAWTPIYSPAPDAVLDGYGAVPSIPGGLAFAKDSADTFYVRGDHDGRVHLNLTFAAPHAYFELPPFANAGLADYAASVRPPISDDLKARAQLVLARAKVDPKTDVALIVRSLASYFQAFGEGPIPEPSQYPDLYLALALGETGCCRHRAFAFAVTAESLGIPTRVVVNEAHAFVEVMLPRGDWHQINLGGCGTYKVNNPNGFRDFLPAASSPKGPPETAPSASLPVGLNLTVVPNAIEKSSSARPQTVTGFASTIASPTRADTVPLANADVDLYLVPASAVAQPINFSVHLSDSTPEMLLGKSTLVGTARTDVNGRFVAMLALTRDVSTGPYVLLAHSLPRRSGSIAYLEAFDEWRFVRVTSASDLNVSLAAAGVGARSLVVVTLVDGLLAPVANATVTLSLDGVPRESSFTDATGAAQFTPTFATAGAHTVLVSFPGTAYVRPSRASSSVTLSRIAFDVEPRLAAVRGETLLVEGRLLRDGTPLSETEVAASLPFALVGPHGRTDATGALRLSLPVPVNATPGPSTLTLTAPGLGATRHVPLTISFRPSLRVEAPTETYRGDAIAVSGAATDETGTPIAALPLALRIDETSGSQVWAHGKTDAAGRFAFSLPANALDAGTAVGSVVANASTRANTASAGASFDLSVSATPPPFRLSPGLVALVGALALVLVAGALWAARRFGARAKPHLRALARRISWRSEVALHVDLPGFPPDLSPAFAPGESLAVVVAGERVFRDKTRSPLARASVGLFLGKRLVATAELNARGATNAVVPLVRIPEGPATLRAVFAGDRRSLPGEARLPLRVTSYRKELERTYRALVSNLALPASATPRDAERAIEGRAPAVASEAGRLAATVERALFTDRPIERADLVAFERLALRIRQEVTRVEPA